MGIIGEIVIDRIDAMERQIRLLTEQFGAQGVPIDVMGEVRKQVALLESRLNEVESSTPHSRRTQDPKDWMPEVLSTNYRDLWRNWAYKSRDWLGQHDPTIPLKLEAVESMTEKLIQEYI